ncbi:hypothetical protein A163_22100 [Vibrio tasmaniensis 1F-267]|uniref:Uncharacterized protein n=1 Tax=Vibrio tasmaniensis 1F-267 TaxID=1191324 RepID=A0ABX3B574_9VIBR|nr:hypothetical protein A163_22100 [Vibrio tasmaniensis 1F-267]
MIEAKVRIGGWFWFWFCFRVLSEDNLGGINELTLNCIIVNACQLFGGMISLVADQMKVLESAIEIDLLRFTYD